ncbi:hypothetical protein IFR05_009337 [Cadophora sp. M221]|nr:hypothetical protein IFR05_009337 [Cadophora sp. M221]
MDLSRLSTGSSPPKIPRPLDEYLYYPLNSSGNGELRLIRLWPGPVDGEDIKLEVFHAWKSSKPVYEALSYTWGSATHTDVALVCEETDRHGKRKSRRHLDETMDESTPVSSLGIAHNLAVALRHLRYPDRERILWADAICINQTDDAERSREVLQMGSIYRNAQQVVVWLGPSEDDSTLALETLDRIGWGVHFDRRTFTVTSKHGRWANALKSNGEMLRAESPRWVAIAKLIRRGWFHRLSLDSTRKSFCSDKKDRLFAIHGLLPPRQKHLITPDYSLRTEEVYKATTISCIKFYTRLLLLPNCILQSSPSDVELPSWVPDFSFKDAPEYIDYSQADGYALGSFSFHEMDILAVQGVKVAEITEAWASNITQRSTIDELGDVWYSFGQQLSLSASYIAGGNVDDALIEAILCGLTEETGPANFGWFPSGKAYKKLLLTPENFDGENQEKRSDGLDRELVFPRFRRSLIGRAFFKTAEGYIGICPESVKRGDYVVVILGCAVPLVLRPDQDNKESFRVVGECYVPGIMNAEGILGSFPPGWTKRKLFSKDESVLMVYEQGIIKTQRDPRASTLPLGWKVMFGTKDCPLENELEDEREWDLPLFMNEDTGETTVYDPRLTPELLKQRGVDIREFRLV